MAITVLSVAIGTMFLWEQTGSFHKHMCMRVRCTLNAGRGRVQELYLSELLPPV